MTTTIDSTGEQLRPLATYSHRLPSGRPGKAIHRATLWRWAMRGVRGGIQLRTTRLGGCRFTCDAWVADFMRRLTQTPTQRAPSATMPVAERRRIEERFELQAEQSRP